MATYVPAKVSTQFIFYTGLVQQSSTLVLKSNPTIASGDFKVSIDGGALANLGTLPTVTPASSVMVKYTLSTSEMAGANATVVSIDASGAEWCDRLDNFQTAARQVDDLAYPATSGRSMVVDASGLVDANTVKVGPTGSGTAQTARDIGASVLLAAAQKVDVDTIKTQAVTCAAGVTVLASVGTAATSTAQTGDGYARLGAPAGASVSADIAAAKVDTAAIKVQTDKLAFTVANQIDANVIDWKGATAPAMTGDAFARLGAPAGASVSVDIAAVQSDTDNMQTRIPAALSNGFMKASLQEAVASGVQDFFTVDSGETFATSVNGSLVGEVANAIGATTPGDIADAILAATIGDGTVTVAQALRVYLAALAGKLSGAATTTVSIRNVADSKDVIVATVDVDGNRTATTVTP